MNAQLRKYLEMMPGKNASDLHIRADGPVFFRIDGSIIKAGEPPDDPEKVKEMILEFLREDQIKKLENAKELDFAFAIDKVGRFRANAYYQRGMLNCAIRLIPDYIRSIEECGLPVDVLEKFCRAQKGLILVTGATGSGKSTTQAAILDKINSERKCHIVTVEDPIEYVHYNKLAMVDQREIHTDTISFHSALRHVLRQDPDVIMVGELRDLETIQEALTAADTGHLVLGTLHTSDCVQSINRMVDVFAHNQQAQIRSQLALVLLGIISQQLLPKKSDEGGMVLASEVLVANPAVRSMIRDSKEHQIASVIQTSQSCGMRTMDQALAELYAFGQVAYEDAIARSQTPEDLEKMIKDGKIYNGSPSR